MELKEVKLNSLNPNLFAPPISAQKSNPNKAQKNNTLSYESAIELLKLVNVGTKVLEVSKLNLTPEQICILAESIKSARKNDLGVEFENGRIIVPENLFERMIKACKKAPENNLSICGYVRPQIENKKL